MTRPMRVLVIGAGPGGLALAHGLHRHGIDVAVHEADDALDARPQGYRIVLRQDGWQHLRTCLPADVFALAEATSGELRGAPTMFDPQLEVVGTWDVTDTGGTGEAGRAPDTARPVDRAVLRRVLIRGLEDRMSFGRRFARFEEHGNQVRAVFADGSDDVGDLVVGADGAFSGIRRQLHPDVGFVRSELVAAMGRTPLTERFAEINPGNGSMIKGPGLNLNVGPMVFRTSPALAAPGLPATDSYLRWLLLLPPDHPVAESARRGTGETVRGAGHDARETVLDLIDGWHPLLRELIERASTHNSWIVTPKLLDRPMSPWEAERVTLLGDAAHLTLPSGGNGLSTALRDAANLTRRLSEADDADGVTDALRAYQQEMLVYGRAAVDVGVARQRHVVPRAA